MGAEFDKADEKPLVSLILVTANRADYLVDVVDAIQAQRERSWEMIAVDCASLDNTLGFLEARAANDARIRVFSIEETDKGIGRRMALTKARGRYLAFPDANSLWSSEFLSCLVPVFDHAPENTGIVYAATEVLGGDGDISKTLPEKLRHGAMVCELFEKPQLPLSALMVRRNLLKPLHKTGMRVWLSNDHALLIWMVYKAPTEPAGAMALARIRPIDGMLPAYLDPVSKARGDALTHALENLPRVVPARFARRCLASFYRARSRALAVKNERGEAFTAAMYALMYRPLWPAAWRHFLRIMLKN